MAYFAWRGLVIEHLFTELLAALEDRFTFYQMTHSHILFSFIPGPADRIAKGEKLQALMPSIHAARDRKKRSLM